MTDWLESKDPNWPKNYFAERVKVPGFRLRYDQRRKRVNIEDVREAQKYDLPRGRIISSVRIPNGLDDDARTAIMNETVACGVASRDETERYMSAHWERLKQIEEEESHE